MLASVSAFIAAVALLIAAITSYGLRKAWPARSFALGIGAGAIIGCVVDLACYHIMHSA
jgi:hypothetical protein